MASTTDIKNGAVLNIDGQLWTVIEFQHVKPGKGGAFVRTKIKNVMSGKVVDRTFNAGAKIETADVDRRDYQYLYEDGDSYVFMDQDTTTRSTCPSTVVGDAKNFMLENQARHDRAERRRPALRRAPDLGRHSRSPTPSPACRATVRPAAPSRRRSRPATRSRSRCSSRGHQGQGRHARRQLPRPRQRLGADRMSARTKARKRALDMLYVADVRRAADRGRPRDRDGRARSTSRSAPQLGLRARDRRRASTRPGYEIDDVIETYAQGGRSPACRSSTAASCAWASGSSCSTTRSPTRSRSAEAVELAQSLSAPTTRPAS